MADQFRVKVLLPAVADPDVESRELSVDVGGTVVEVRPLDKGTPDTELLLDQDAAVHLSLIDVDHAGNRSEASVFDFVVSDTVPPAQPGL
mgnify:CR=1 FL=1